MADFAYLKLTLIILPTTGEKMGHGTYIASTGAIYEGQYQGDVRHGQGTFKYPDGRVFKGYWDNDEAVGMAPPTPSYASSSAKARRTKIGAFFFAK